jgi:hypothetical protein
MSRPLFALSNDLESDRPWNTPINPYRNDSTPFDPKLWAQELGNILGVDPARFTAKSQSLSTPHARIVAAIISSAPENATTCTIGQEELASVLGFARGKQLSREYLNRELAKIRKQGWLDWKANKRRDLGHSREGYRGWRAAANTYSWTEATVERVKITLGGEEWEKITTGARRRGKQDHLARLPFKKITVGVEVVANNI